MEEEEDDSDDANDNHETGKYLLGTIIMKITF